MGVYSSAPVAVFSQLDDASGNHKAPDSTWLPLSYLTGLISVDDVGCEACRTMRYEKGEAVNVGCESTEAASTQFRKTVDDAKT